MVLEAIPDYSSYPFCDPVWWKTRFLETTAAVQPIMFDVKQKMTEKYIAFM